MAQQSRICVGLYSDSETKLKASQGIVSTAVSVGSGARGDRIHPGAETWKEPYNAKVWW